MKYEVSFSLFLQKKQTWQVDNQRINRWLQDVNIPGKLKQFLLDLHSGKLHREFHYGPDTTVTETINSNQIGGDGGAGTGGDGGKVPTTPPESTFKKLAPSKNRYTLLDKDEL